MCGALNWKKFEMETAVTPGITEFWMPDRDDNHAGEIGYLRGRLDGHDTRITAVEVALQNGLEKIGDRLNGQDEVLGRINNLLSRWGGMVVIITLLGSAGLTLLVAAWETHWGPFK